MNRRGAFKILNKETIRANFDETLVNYLIGTEFTAITCVIDKKRMIGMTYWSQKHPYHYLMEILVEKYTQWLERHDGIGDVMPEKRQGKKDAALQEAFAGVLDSGTSYVKAECMKSRIFARKLKFRTKREDVAGLQICDVIAHPSHMYIRRSRDKELVLGTYA